MAKIIDHFDVEVIFPDGSRVVGISSYQPGHLGQSGEPSYYHLYTAPEINEGMLVTLANVRAIITKPVYKDLDNGKA